MARGSSRSEGDLRATRHHPGTGPGPSARAEKIRLSALPNGRQDRSAPAPTAAKEHGLARALGAYRGREVPGCPAPPSAGAHPEAHRTRSAPATLAAWMIKLGIWIQPLINLLQDVLLGYDILHMDETTLQVLKDTREGPSFALLSLGTARWSPASARHPLRLRSLPKSGGALPAPRRLPRLSASGWL